ncbi:MAG: hypothetical protein P8Q92_09175 [Pseudoprimorskyibacter sp.]|nr:hypothetical protein [Pseudoprimorskyibacter sp.]
MIYRFDDKRTGEIYIAVRGTDQLIPFTGGPDVNEDSFMGDSGQYGNIGVGNPTSAGCAAALKAREIFEETGKQVTVVGHSYGGYTAEVVGLLEPQAIKHSTNVQGPSVVDSITVSAGIYWQGEEVFPSYTSPVSYMGAVRISNDCGETEQVS